MSEKPNVTIGPVLMDAAQPVIEKMMQVLDTKIERQVDPLIARIGEITRQMEPLIARIEDLEAQLRELRGDTDEHQKS